MTPAFPMLIDGAWRNTPATVEIRSPHDGRLVGITCLGGADDVEAALAAATRAFETWRRAPTFERAALLERILAGVRREQESLARLIAGEAGKPLRTARIEVSRCLATLTDAIEETRRLRGEWLPLDLDAASAGRSAIVRRFPRGPVTAITPFNFPLNLVAHKLAPALAAGNTVVLKPSPQAPLSALRLAQLVHEAGAPAGVVNVLLCDHTVAAPLVTDSRVKFLTFTGGVATGWALRQQAGRKPVTLELGGNAAAIIEPDADLDLAAARCAAGGFAHAGQSCISVQRAFVHESVAAEFTAKFLARVDALRVGDPMDEATDVGPLIAEREAVRVESWIREAVAGGARVLAGGRRTGAILEPTVLTGTTPAMKLRSEEVFGPVVVVEPYPDFATVLRWVNDSRFGLQAGLFTRRLDAAFVAYQELDIGGLILNDVPTWRADPMPYGGVKDSGMGREGARYAIEEMTELRVLVLNTPAGA